MRESLRKDERMKELRNKEIQKDRKKEITETKASERERERESESERERGTPGSENKHQEVVG